MYLLYIQTTIYLNLILAKSLSIIYDIRTVNTYVTFLLRKN